MGDGRDIVLTLVFIFIVIVIVWVLTLLAYKGVIKNDKLKSWFPWATAAIPIWFILALFIMVSTASDSGSVRMRPY